MNNISVVIITKNEGHIISQMLDSIQGLSHDIIVVDSGSTDDTRKIVVQRSCNLVDTNWQGFGINKNKGIETAKNDWILSLDADEFLSEELLSNLKNIDLSDANVVYELRFTTYFGNKRLHFGEWGRNEKHVRLFNRRNIRWNDAQVHEQLIIPVSAKTKTVDGFVKHYTVKDVSEYAKKTTRYAILNADKYFLLGKKPNWFKLYYGHSFSFAWNYVFRLGFLDGYEGYLTAKMTAHYTMLKYARLRELWKNADKNK